MIKQKYVIPIECVIKIESEFVNQTEILLKLLD